MEEILHQLRLVVFLLIYKVLYIQTVVLWHFLPSTVSTTQNKPMVPRSLSTPKVSRPATENPESGVQNLMGKCGLFGGFNPFEKSARQNIAQITLFLLGAVLLPFFEGVRCLSHYFFSPKKTWMLWMRTGIFTYIDPRKINWMYVDSISVICESFPLRHQHRPTNRGKRDAESRKTAVSDAEFRCRC